MEPTTRQPSKTQKAFDTDSSSPVDQVTDILFGSRLREQEKVIANLGSKIETEFKTLRNEYISRLNDLEVFFKSELKSFDERLKIEHENNEKAMQRFNSETADLRHLILNRTKSLGEDIHSTQNKFAVTMKEDLNLMDQRKVDRTVLIELLNEWAMRLNTKIELKNGKHH